MDRLLEKGANVNANVAQYYGRTAHQAASEGGHLAVVDRLLEKRANANAKATRSSGRTALQAASEGGHLAVVNRLLEKGANVNAEGCTVERKNGPTGSIAARPSCDSGTIAERRCNEIKCNQPPRCDLITDCTDIPFRSLHPR